MIHAILRTFYGLFCWSQQPDTVLLVRNKDVFWIYSRIFQKFWNISLKIANVKAAILSAFSRIYFVHRKSGNAFMALFAAPFKSAWIIVPRLILYWDCLIILSENQGFWPLSWFSADQTGIYPSPENMLLMYRILHSSLLPWCLLLCISPWWKCADGMGWKVWLFGSCFHPLFCSITGVLIFSSLSQSVFLFDAAWRMLLVVFCQLLRFGC